MLIQGAEFAKFCEGTETRTIIREPVRFPCSRNVRVIFHEQARKLVRDSSPRIWYELSELLTKYSLKYGILFF